MLLTLCNKQFVYYSCFFKIYNNIGFDIDNLKKVNNKKIVYSSVTIASMLSLLYNKTELHK